MQEEAHCSMTDIQSVIVDVLDVLRRERGKLEDRLFCVLKKLFKHDQGKGQGPPLHFYLIARIIAFQLLLVNLGVASTP